MSVTVAIEAEWDCLTPEQSEPESIPEWTLDGSAKSFSIAQQLHECQ